MALPSTGPLRTGTAQQGLCCTTSSQCPPVYIQNDDDNKVFSISFRTTPSDSTGVPHICEHSTLCGSRKFPLKEPFVELVKGSLNTFLNAMTFPDKTMYPVASRNAADFKNLMDVYLDAVFFPNMIKDKQVLMQEGWHYHLDSADDEADLSRRRHHSPEMKGVFSSTGLADGTARHGCPLPGYDVWRRIGRQPR